MKKGFEMALGSVPIALYANRLQKTAWIRGVSTICKWQNGIKGLRLAKIVEHLSTNVQAHRVIIDPKLPIEHRTIAKARQVSSS